MRQPRDQTTTRPDKVRQKAATRQYKITKDKNKTGQPQEKIRQDKTSQPHAKTITRQDKSRLNKKRKDKSRQD
jgi:hypothetical protein